MKPANALSTFETLPADGYKIVKLTGRLDTESAKAFNDTLGSLMDPPSDVIVNMANASDICVAWIRALMAVQQSCKSLNKQMRLICVPKEVTSIFRREGMSGSFKHFPNLREALVDLGLTTAQILDVGFINPFLVATIHVLETQASTKSTAGKIYKKQGNEKFTGDISGVIGLVSEAFTGSVVISFPEETFLKVISRMLGEEHTKMSKDIEDGAGEITNMIFGQAKVSLNEKGYGIKTALPSIVSGVDHSIAQLSNGPRVVVPFSTDVGPFFIEICVSA